MKLIEIEKDKVKLPNIRNDKGEINKGFTGEKLT